MNVLQTSLCFFLLSLQVGTVDALNHFYRLPGEELFIRCYFSRLYGGQKIFCRENCEGENLFIATSQKTAQNGRYRTEFIEEGFEDLSPGSPGLSVRALNLTPSDSGLFKCGLGNSSSSATYVQFRVLVADAVLDGNKVHHLSKAAGSSLTVACSFSNSGTTKSLCRGECEENTILLQVVGDTAQSHRHRIENNKTKTSGGHLYVSFKHLDESDSGPYRCYLDKSYREFNIAVEPPASASVSSGPSDQQNTTSGATSHNYVPLIVGLTLGVSVVLLSAALLVSCRRRCLEGLRTRRSPEGSNMETVAMETCTSQDEVYENFCPVSKGKGKI